MNNLDRMDLPKELTSPEILIDESLTSTQQEEVISEFSEIPKTATAKDEDPSAFSREYASISECGTRRLLVLKSKDAEIVDFTKEPASRFRYVIQRRLVRKIKDAGTLDLTKEPAYRFRYVIQRRIVRTIKKRKNSLNENESHEDGKTLERSQATDLYLPITQDIREKRNILFLSRRFSLELVSELEVHKDWRIDEYLRNYSKGANQMSAESILNPQDQPSVWLPPPPPDPPNPQ